MALPDFDHNHVIPPHLGNPANRTLVSPYECTSLEFCQKFATSPQRIEILKFFITFRERIAAFGIVRGFNWLNGSFSENIEVSEGRPPRDLDVVTFYRDLTSAQVADIRMGFPEFINPTLAKGAYKLDHYPVDYGYSPEATVEQTRYWLQLFSHNRYNVWKGIIRINLNTPADDENSRDFLNGLV